ncbi:MAG: hypothetical protein RLZZ326_3075, partial [Planctomycetota bacterium]
FTSGTGSAGAIQTISGFVYQSSLPVGATPMAAPDAAVSQADVSQADMSQAAVSEAAVATMSVVEATPVHHGITGQQITLISLHGRIGTPTQAVRVHGGQTLFQEGVNLQAQGHVSVIQEIGDLLVQSATSQQGDVLLAAAQGSIVGSDSKIQRDTRPLAEKQADWERMGLTGQAAIGRALRHVETLYHLYWEQYRGISTFGNSTVIGAALGADWKFTFTDTERRDLQARQVTDSQIAQIEGARTQQGRELEAAFSGGTYRPNFTATLENAPAPLLKIVQWDPQALANAPAAEAFFGHASSTVEGQPTIVGRNVTLRAAQDVGTSSHPRVITLGAGPLSADAWFALSTAEPGTIRQNGNVLTVDGSNPLRVAASGRFAALAAGSLTTSPGNIGPATVALANAVQSLAEKTAVGARLFIADIAVSDDSLGDNQITLSGTDAELFEVLGKRLYLREGVWLDHFVQPSLAVTVSVADRFRPGAAVVSVEHRLEITNDAPHVTGITVPAGYLRAGQTILLQVAFDEPVVVTGDLWIPIVVGKTPRFASYVSGSGDNILKFAYTVIGGENDADGIFVAEAIVMGSVSIHDRNGLAGTGTLTSIDASAVRVDTAAPVLKSVTAPAAGSYAAGSELRFAVHFSEPMLFTGAPYLALTGIRGGSQGSAPRRAVAVSGAGTDTLIFAYMIQPGESAGAVKLAGVSSRWPWQIQIQVRSDSSLTDRAGQPAAKLIALAPRLAGVRVDGVIPHAVGVVGPAAKTYVAGNVLEFTVAWSRKVVVDGIPELEVTIGNVTRIARYVSGSGTSILRFRLVVQAGDNGAVAVTGQLLLPAGARISAAGNEATLALPHTAAKRRAIVDTVAPAVAHLQLPVAGTYVPGQRLRVSVEFTENVMVHGAVWIEALVGNETRRFVCTSGSGSKRLVFSYVVSQKDKGLDGLELLGEGHGVRGGISDLAGNRARIDLPAGGKVGVSIRRQGVSA